MTERQEQPVDVRRFWEHEALDFTPWLAKNLDLLGDAIGLKLELVQQEKLLGSMYLDILAKESGSCALVAIENQLEWSDTDHMGRLLMYAAGSEAKVVIWVATEFMYEHAQVFNQLNEWAGSNASFYAVKVEAIKKADNSDPEAKLLKVVWPGGWDKTRTLDPVPPPRPEIQQHEEFFRPIVAKMIRPEMNFASSCRQAWGYAGRFFPSDFDSEIGYTVEMGNRKSWVTILIRTWNSVDLNNRLFDKLKEQQTSIESSIAEQGEWYWNRYSNFTFSIISISKPGSIDDPPDKLEETRAWMAEMLPKFKEVFEERVDRLLTELRNQPANAE